MDFSDVKIKISCNHEELDEAIEKANQLLELLVKVQKITDSLFGTEKTDT